MQRIAIIGNAAGGKSLLARQMGDVLGLPVHSVDDVQWRAGWMRADSIELSSTLEAWQREPEWVIDGWGPWESIERRFDAADTIVFVDLPLMRHYWWALKRQFESSTGMRKDWPPRGCRPLPITLTLLALIRRIHHEARPRIAAALSTPAIAQRVVHIRSVDDLQNFRNAIARCAIPLAKG